MRQGFSVLLFALSPYIVSAPIHAEDILTPNIMTIDDRLFDQQSRLQKAKQEIDVQNRLIAEQQAHVHTLTQQLEALNRALQDAKSDLDDLYRSMILDPDIDIAPAQNSYQDVWVKLKQKKQALVTAQETIQKQKAALNQAHSDKQELQQRINTLNKDKIRSRATRLAAELRREGEQKTSFTFACTPEMTLAQCSEQTSELALQKSVSQFQTWLINQSSESALIRENLDDAKLNIHIVRHIVTEAGFVEENKYRVTLQAKMNAQPSSDTPCKLLGLDPEYCKISKLNKEYDAQQEIVWVNLIIRSNQFDDQVTVDGVSYGASPIDIMLPVGEHAITVSKKGFRTYQQEINITSDRSLRANLKAKDNKLTTGHKFADTIYGDGQAPTMISLESGTYQLGNDKDNIVYLDHAFAISTTPITVSQYETFVNQTGYQTDAEIQKLCIAVDNAEVAPQPGSNWRNPGFKQSAQSPVVCISQNDAWAYTEWLSQKTGFHYRLPSENEWEAAARAGSKTAYWWGEHFGTGNANTGWGGTPWSNKSTSPVGAFTPNPLGFYDVVGNVWQWTTDQRGLAKGGAWSFSPEMAKADSQLFIAPSAAANYVGFRILREL